MPIMTQPAFGPKLAIGFITGGTLLDVWTLVWRYTVAPPELTPSQRFWFMGLLLTGLTFVVIGAFLGHIGRAARKAELPPTDETTRAEAAIQARAATNPNPGVAAASTVPPNAAPAAVPTGAQVTAMPGQVMPGIVR